MSGVEDMVPRQLGHSAAADSGGVRKRLAAFRELGWSPGRQLLDVGCGTGSYTLRMAEDFDETVGVDLQAEHLAEFRRRLSGSLLEERVSVRELSVTHLPFDDGQFDVVTAIETIEHIDDLRAGLAEIWRVLRPGGRLFITCPNRLYPLETHAVRIGNRSIAGSRLPFLPWIPRLHSRLSEARTFTPRSLRSVLRSAGFHPGATTWIMPPFDHNRVAAKVRPVTDLAERMPALRQFGVSIVMVATRPSRGSALPNR